MQLTPHTLALMYCVHFKTFSTNSCARVPTHQTIVMCCCIIMCVCSRLINFMCTASILFNFQDKFSIYHRLDMVCFFFSCCHSHKQRLRSSSSLQFKFIYIYLKFKIPEKVGRHSYRSAKQQFFRVYTTQQQHSIIIQYKTP